jgi:hypothetical protein
VIILKSLLLGYLGAVLAGLAVGIVGAIVDASPAAVASAAMPIGMAVGIMALSLVWWRPLAARLARIGSSRTR